MERICCVIVIKSTTPSSFLILYLHSKGKEEEFEEVRDTVKFLALQSLSKSSAVNSEQFLSGTPEQESEGVPSFPHEVHNPTIIKNSSTLEYFIISQFCRLLNFFTLYLICMFSILSSSLISVQKVFLNMNRHQNVLAARTGILVCLPVASCVSPFIK